MDGINGITGGYSLVILGALAYINSEITTFVEPALINTVLCAVLVFCFFNFRKKAKCFPEAETNVAGAVKKLGTKYLRYPGGEKSDFYFFSVSPYETSHPTLCRTASSQIPTCCIDLPGQNCTSHRNNPLYPRATYCRELLITIHKELSAITSFSTIRR